MLPPPYVSRMRFPSGFITEGSFVIESFPKMSLVGVW